MIKVAKFGGTSLANAGQFRKTADIIRGDKDRRYIVPSAPGKRSDKDNKITDMLYAMYHVAIVSSDKEEFHRILTDIQARYEEIVSELTVDVDIRKEFKIIKDNIFNGAGEDYAASRGEYLNSIILSKLIGFEFIDAVDVIAFNAEGEFDSVKSDALIKEYLAHVDYAVIPGFYGAMPDGSVKTFSRGGSDITGSIVAKSVSANLYENWTDVSGFLVADPHIIDHPETIDVITYRELRELSYMGASVLHEDAIFPVHKQGIPINIKNTNTPEDKGTYIVKTTCSKPYFTITGIAGKKDFASVTIEKDMMNAEVGFCMKVLEVFNKHGVSIEHMPSGIDTMTIFVHQDEFQEKEQEIVAGIQNCVHPDSLDLESDLALIAVVGRGMKSTRGTSGRIFSALAHANVNVKMIDQGSSELNIIIGVHNHDFETAIKAIYDIFVSSRL